MELASQPSKKNMVRVAHIGFRNSYFVYEFVSLHTSLGIGGLRLDGAVICNGIDPRGDQLPKFYESGIELEMAAGIRNYFLRRLSFSLRNLRPLHVAVQNAADSACRLERFRGYLPGSGSHDCFCQ